MKYVFTHSHTHTYYNVITNTTTASLCVFLLLSFRCQLQEKLKVDMQQATFLAMCADVLYLAGHMYKISCVKHHALY